MTWPRLSPTSSISQCGSSNCAIRIVYAVSITIGCSVFPSILRPRIAGTVIRLPGTGIGVARLVAVSIVNVDMAAPSSRCAVPQPAPLRQRPADKEDELAPDAAATTGETKAKEESKKASKKADKPR
jgi:hypothetical protein